MCRRQRAANTEAGKRDYLQPTGQHSCCFITLARVSLSGPIRKNKSQERQFAVILTGRWLVALILSKFKEAAKCLYPGR